MDRRLLFPAVAMTAWAQQANPGAAKAEKALRARVQEFYQLQVDKEYRKVEPMVSDDSKDLYYNAAKPDLKAFSLEKVEILDRNHARVTAKTTQFVLMPGAGVVPFDFPNTTLWKKEKGKWVYYIDQDALKNTPFGRFKAGDEAAKLDRTGEAPSVTNLLSQISIDRTSVELTDSQPAQAVTITNGLPGLVELKLDPHAEKIKGLSIEISPEKLNGGEKASIDFHLAPGSRFSDVVRVTAWPMGKPFDIQVNAK